MITINFYGETILINMLLDSKSLLKTFLFPLWSYMTNIQG